MGVRDDINRALARAQEKARARREELAAQREEKRERARKKRKPTGSAHLDPEKPPPGGPAAKRERPRRLVGCRLVNIEAAREILKLGMEACEDDKMKALATPVLERFTSMTIRKATAKEQPTRPRRRLHEGGR